MFWNECYYIEKKITCQEENAGKFAVFQNHRGKFSEKLVARLVKPKKVVYNRIKSLGGVAVDGLRYENKYYISRAGYAQLRTRIAAGLEKDAHILHPDGRYLIRSLYFDDYRQSGLLDKVEGVEKREKFRIRFYDHDDSFIRLEAKQKLGQMTRKLSAPLTRQQTDRILAGDIWWMLQSEHPLIRNFYLKLRTRLLRPAVIVDYEREPYVFEDVRITFDMHLRSGKYGHDLFNKELFTVPVLHSDRMVLEVKYNDALPYMVRKLLDTVPLARSAVSKYELCRSVQ